MWRMRRVNLCDPLLTLFCGIQVFLFVFYYLIVGLKGLCFKEVQLIQSIQLDRESPVYLIQSQDSISVLCSYSSRVRCFISFMSSRASWCSTLCHIFTHQHVPLLSGLCQSVGPEDCPFPHWTASQWTLCQLFHETLGVSKVLLSIQWSLQLSKSTYLLFVHFRRLTWCWTLCHA